MSLLERVLPGLREARIPLVVGYAYLIAAWAAFYEQLPETEDEVDAGSVADASRRLFEVLSTFAELALLSVVAYLLGTLTAAVWEALVRIPDERILVERAQQRYAEARLRLQLSLPIGMLVAVFVVRGGARWFLLGIVPVALLIHGIVLRLQAARIPARRDLADADLAALFLRGVNLRYADLTRADIRGADFGSVRSRLLLGAVTRRSDLVGVKLGDTSAAGVNLSGALLDAPTLIAFANAGVKLREVELSVDKNLSEARLSGVDLEGANLIGADLTGADLTGAKLSGVELSGAILTGANLAGADLTDTWLMSKNLSNVNLAGANLTRAVLMTADLGGADLTGANLTDADLIGAVWDDRTRWDDATRWPEGFKLSKANDARPNSDA